MACRARRLFWVTPVVVPDCLSSSARMSAMAAARAARALAKATTACQMVLKLSSTPRTAMNILVCACCFIFIIFESWNFNVLPERLEISQRPAPLIIKNCQILGFYCVFDPPGGLSMVKTRHSMVVARLAMPAGPPEAATGRHSTSAGKVTMAKTEHSMVAGRLTRPPGSDRCSPGNRH